MSTFGGIIREYPLLSVDRFEKDNLKSTVFFLSHCHTDHMIGLSSNEFTQLLSSRSFSKVYVSEISRRLLSNDKKYLCIVPFLESIPLEQCTIIEVCDENGKKKHDIMVTLLPAGHCPGSVMFLFEGAMGTVLYTGDFRLQRGSMCRLKPLHHLDGRVKVINKLYLDTTFCNKKSLHIASRQESLMALTNLIEPWIKLDDINHIYFVTPAKFGYESVFVHIYEKIQMKVHISVGRYEMYGGIPEILEVVTLDAASTRIHCCEFARNPPRGHREAALKPLPCIGSPNNCAFMDPRKRLDKKNLVRLRYIKLSVMVFALYPSLTEIVQFDEPKCMYRVCFSTHPSLSELIDMARYLKPQEIYPNVVPDGLLPFQVLKPLLSALNISTAPEVISNDIPCLGELKTSRETDSEDSCDSGRKKDYIFSLPFSQDDCDSYCPVNRKEDLNNAVPCSDATKPPGLVTKNFTQEDYPLWESPPLVIDESRDSDKPASCSRQGSQNSSEERYGETSQSDRGHSSSLHLSSGEYELSPDSNKPHPSAIKSCDPASNLMQLCPDNETTNLFGRNGSHLNSEILNSKTSPSNCAMPSSSHSGGNDQNELSQSLIGASYIPLLSGGNISSKNLVHSVHPLCSNQLHNEAIPTSFTSAVDKNTSDKSSAKAKSSSTSGSSSLHLTSDESPAASAPFCKKSGKTLSVEPQPPAVRFPCANFSDYVNRPYPDFVTFRDLVQKNSFPCYSTTPNAHVNGINQEQHISVNYSMLCESDHGISSSLHLSSDESPLVEQLSQSSHSSSLLNDRNSLGHVNKITPKGKSVRRRPDVLQRRVTPTTVSSSRSVSSKISLHTRESTPFPVHSLEKGQQNFVHPPLTAQKDACASTVFPSSICGSPKVSSCMFESTPEQDFNEPLSLTKNNANDSYSSSMLKSTPAFPSCWSREQNMVNCKSQEGLNRPPFVKQNGQDDTSANFLGNPCNNKAVIIQNTGSAPVANNNNFRESFPPLPVSSSYNSPKNSSVASCTSSGASCSLYDITTTGSKRVHNSSFSEIGMKRPRISNEIIDPSSADDNQKQSESANTNQIYHSCSSYHSTVSSPSDNVTFPIESEMGVSLQGLPKPPPLALIVGNNSVELPENIHESLFSAIADLLPPIDVQEFLSHMTDNDAVVNESYVGNTNNDVDAASESPNPSYSNKDNLPDSQEPVIICEDSSSLRRRGSFQVMPDVNASVNEYLSRPITSHIRNTSVRDDNFLSEMDDHALSAEEEIDIIGDSSSSDGTEEYSSFNCISHAQDSLYPFLENGPSAAPNKDTSGIECQPAFTISREGNTSNSDSTSSESSSHHSASLISGVAYQVNTQPSDIGNDIPVINLSSDTE